MTKDAATNGTGNPMGNPLVKEEGLLLAAAAFVEDDSAADWGLDPSKTSSSSFTATKCAPR